MKKFDWLLISLIIIIAMAMLLSFCGKSHASECDNPQYLLSQDGINQCIIFGEQLERCEYISQSQDELINQMQQKIDVMDASQAKLLEAINSYEKAIQAYKEVIKIKDEEAVIKDKQCKEEIKKAKPSFFHQLGIFGWGVMTGVATAIAGAILLL
jgi:CII-binding regulator of phage lambda lysogenization HflD